MNASAVPAVCAAVPKKSGLRPGIVATASEPVTILPLATSCQRERGSGEKRVGRVNTARTRIKTLAGTSQLYDFLSASVEPPSNPRLESGTRSVVDLHATRLSKTYPVLSLGPGPVCSPALTPASPIGPFLALTKGGRSSPLL
jgi:hypothetical protein